MLSEVARIRTVCAYRAIDLRSLTPIFPHLAGQLETLMVVIGPTEPFRSRNVRNLRVKLPRLRTLSIAHTAVWRAWTMRELRHLSLTSQRWEIEDLRAFFTILKTNPRLEELMLSKITPGDRGAFIQGTHPPIHMPKLKRLFVEQFTKDDIYPIFSIVHRTLSLPPTCTRYYHLVEPGPLPVTTTFDNRYVYPVPVERVVMSSRFLIGTDGISACIIEREMSPFHFMQWIEDTRVKELWLDKSLPKPFRSAFGINMPPEETARSAIRRMNKVTKLVIMRDIVYWLESIENDFPDLIELHIHTYYMSQSDRAVVDQFLARRKRYGLQLNTLHIVGPPDSHGCEVFNNWRAQSSDVEPLADEVIFEKVRPRLGSEQAQFNRFVSTRLGLPEVCKHTSKIHTVWKPWNAYIALAESRIHQQLQAIWQQVA